MEVKLFCTIPVARVFYMYLDLCYNGNMLHFLYDDEITIPTYLSGSIFHLIRGIKLALLIILEHKTSFNSQLIIFSRGPFIWRCVGLVRRASSPRWDDFYPTFIWNLLSQFKKCFYNKQWRKAIMQNKCSYII